MAEDQGTLGIVGEGNELLGDHGDMAGRNHWLVAWLHARNQGAYGHSMEASVHYDHCSLRAISPQHNDLQAAVQHHSIGLGLGEVALDKGRSVVRHKEVAVDIGLEGMVDGRSWDGSCWKVLGLGHAREGDVHALGPIEAEGGMQEDVRHRMEEDCDEEDMAVAGHRIRNDPGASRDSLRAHRYNDHRVLGRDDLLDPGRVEGKLELGVHNLEDHQKKPEAVEVEERTRNPTW